MKKLFFLFAFLLCASFADAATNRWADDTGSAGTCPTGTTDPGGPYCSLATAIAATVGASCDTVTLKAGTYSNDITTLPAGTSWSCPVTLTKAAGETVTLTGWTYFAGTGPTVNKYIIIKGISKTDRMDKTGGSTTGYTNGPRSLRFHYLSISGIDNNNCISGFGGDSGGNMDAQFIGLLVRDCGGTPAQDPDGLKHGFYLQESGLLVEDNDISIGSGKTGYGIQLQGCSGATNPIIVRDNIIHENGSESGSMVLNNCGSVQVYRNVFYQEAGFWGGIAINNQSNHQIWNNTFDDITGLSGAINLNGSVSNAQLRNNIVKGTGTINIGSSASSNIVTHNTTQIAIVNNGTGTTLTSNNVRTVTFVNEAGRDYSLPPGSPEIDAGINVGLPFNGGAPDRGFSESGVAATNIVYVKGSCTNNITTYNPTADTCTGGSDRVFSGIQNAHDWASLAAGHIIDVRAGTYSEDISITKSGSAGNPITLRKHAGETVTAGALGFIWEPVVSYWTIDGFIFDGNLTGPRLEFNAGFTGQMTNVIIRNSTFQDGGRHCLFGFGSFNLFQDVIIQDCGLAQVNHDDYGFYFSGSDTIFERITMRRVRGYGFHIFDSGSDIVARNVVRYSTIGPDVGLRSGEGGHALLISTGANNEAYSNIITGNNGGIQVDFRCHDCKVFNNTIFGNASDGIAVGANNDSIGVVIRNNIIYSNGANGVTVLGGTGHIITNQHCDSAVTGCISAGNPRFADPANGNFRLCTAAGVPHASCVGPSPALDQGATLGPPWNTAFDGTARPQGNFYDIGAYESSAGPPPVGECPAPALVAQYGFDNAATDSSGNANHATLGAGLTYVTGKYNQGVQFPGTAGITVPHSASLFLPCGYTFEAWIDIPSALTDFIALITSNYVGQDGWFLYASSSTNVPLAGYCADVTCPEVLTSALSTDMTHIAATWDNSLGSANLKMFINGVQISTANGTATLTDWIGDMYIGHSPFGEFLPNLTVVDEIRIYNHPRTVGQIITDMTTPIGAASNTIAIKVGAGVVLKWGASTQKKVGLVP